MYTYWTLCFIFYSLSVFLYIKLFFIYHKTSRAEAHRPIPIT